MVDLTPRTVISAHSAGIQTTYRMQPEATPAEAEWIWDGAAAALAEAAEVAAAERAALQQRMDDAVAKLQQEMAEAAAAAASELERTRREHAVRDA